MSRRGLLVASALLATLAGLAACGSAPDPRTAALPALPDLHAMADSVRDQIQAQRTTVEGALQNGAVPDATLAHEFGVMGQLLMAAESVAAAETYFSRAAQLAPADPRWPYYLGHLHRMQGHTELAARFFAETLALQPADTPALVWLGNTYLDQGQPGQATPLYERALAQQPGLFAALFGLGRAALVAGSYAKAAGYFEAALAAEPRASAVHYPLALAYRELGRVNDAEAQLRLRGRNAPPPPDPLMQDVAGLLQSPVVFEGQGDRALARGDARSAVAAFRKGLDLAPDRAALKQKLATSLALTGDVPAAIELYQQLLRQNPDFAEAHYSIGALFLGNGQPDRAIERFAAAVKADPTYLPARLQLAHTLRQVGRPAQALDAYQGALTLDPRLAQARLGYAVSLAALSRWGSARAWLTEGRRAYPDQLEFSELLVRLLSAAPDANVRDGTQALELARGLVAQSRTWRTLEAMAMALAETGDYGGAAARQRDAMEIRRRDTGTSSAAMADTLRLYEQRQPCRVPWSADSVP